MKIEHNLPQFTHERVLLVVAGETTARFLRAGDSEIVELSEYVLPKEKYSDHEGFTAKGAHSSNFVSGSVLEVNKQHMHSQFLHGLNDEIVKLHEEWLFNSIYLFSPAYMSKSIIGSLSKPLALSVRLSLAGNHLHKKPFELLKLIAKEEQAVRNRRKILSLEVKRLLNASGASR